MDNHAEIDVSSVGSEPTVNSSPLIREYRIVTVGTARNLCQVLEQYSSAALYTCEIPNFAFRKDDVTMHLGSSISEPVIATSKITNWERNIELSFGSVPPQDAHHRIPDVKRVTMVRQQPLLKVNCFAISMILPSPNERRDFIWKGTHDVDGGFWQKMDATHVKLVDTSTNEVVAKFIHQTSSMGPTNGTFQIYQDLGGQAWDEMVLLSGISLMKFIKKMRSHNPF